MDYLTPLIQHPDAKLKRNVGAALAQIAKHTAELADALVQAELFPSVCPHTQSIRVRGSVPLRGRYGAHALKERERERKKERERERGTNRGESFRMRRGLVADSSTLISAHASFSPGIGLLERFGSGCAQERCDFDSRGTRSGGDSGGCDGTGEQSFFLFVCHQTDVTNRSVFVLVLWSGRRLPNTHPNYPPPLLMPVAMRR